MSFYLIFKWTYKGFVYTFWHSASRWVVWGFFWVDWVHIRENNTNKKMRGKELLVSIRLSQTVSALDPFKRHAIHWLQWTKSLMSPLNDPSLFIPSKVLQPMTLTQSLVLGASICWLPAHRSPLFHSIPKPQLTCYETFGAVFPKAWVSPIHSQ